MGRIAHHLPFRNGCTAKAFPAPCAGQIVVSAFPWQSARSVRSAVSPPVKIRDFADWTPHAETNRPRQHHAAPFLGTGTGRNSPHALQFARWAKFPPVVPQNGQRQMIGGDGAGSGFWGIKLTGPALEIRA